MDCHDIVAMPWVTCIKQCSTPWTLGNWRSIEWERAQSLPESDFVQQRSDESDPLQWVPSCALQAPDRGPQESPGLIKRMLYPSITNWIELYSALLFATLWTLYSNKPRILVLMLFVRRLCAIMLIPVGWANTWARPSWKMRGVGGKRTDYMSWPNS